VCCFFLFRCEQQYSDLKTKKKKKKKKKKKHTGDTTPRKEPRDCDFSAPGVWAGFSKLLLDSGAAKVAVLDPQHNPSAGVGGGGGSYVADGGRADITQRSSLAVAQPKRVVYSQMHRARRTFLSVVSKLE
jgi:hypothetical protein